MDPPFWLKAVSKARIAFESKAFRGLETESATHSGG
jgi:hypothetical protein